MKANTIYTILGIIVLIAIIYAIYRVLRVKGVKSGPEAYGRTTNQDSSSGNQSQEVVTLKCEAPQVLTKTAWNTFTCSGGTGPDTDPVVVVSRVAGPVKNAPVMSGENLHITCPSTSTMQCSPISVNTPNGVVTGCRCIVVGRNTPQFGRAFIKNGDSFLPINEAGKETVKCTDELCQRLGETYHCKGNGCVDFGTKSKVAYTGPTVKTVVTPNAMPHFNMSGGANGNPAMK